MSEWAKYLILASSFSVLAISYGIGLWAKKKLTSPEAFFTPATSVRRSRRSAFSAAAMAVPWVESMSGPAMSRNIPAVP